MFTAFAKFNLFNNTMLSKEKQEVEIGGRRRGGSQDAV